MTSWTRPEFGLWRLGRRWVGVVSGWVDIVKGRVDGLGRSGSGYV